MSAAGGEEDIEESLVKVADLATGTPEQQVVKLMVGTLAAVAGKISERLQRYILANNVRLTAELRLLGLDIP